MNILDKLEDYFKKNTKENVLKDWEKSKKYDDIGVRVLDFKNYEKETMKNKIQSTNAFQSLKQKRLE